MKNIDSFANRKETDDGSKHWVCDYYIRIQSLPNSKRINRRLSQKPLKNKINPQKLLLSKWTAVTVLEKEKHFLVTKVHWMPGSNLKLDQVTIEAILSKNTKMIPWETLKDRSQWLPGWLSVSKDA